ncbi:uncharacterized protein ATC70_007354 [Mucor velutinosus]|uniref:GATA-type domain-containing protein n=1 Tax=Mucor velutinosus TaxID=708070 RepID=A0AAN7D5E2_9FUNG|nr:hypothetical protein ATC70_007354 [Mucor velutinosus]
MTDYFGPSFPSNPATNDAPGTDGRAFNEEDGNSSASTSPAGNLILGYSSGVNPNTVYYASTQQFPTMLYEYYDGHAYSQAYPGQQSMVYSSSLSSEDHLYVQNGEMAPNTTSPTSSVSSGSYANSASNIYLDVPREGFYLNDTMTAGRESTEHITASPGSNGSPAHLKRRAIIPQSAFNHLTLTDPASMINGSGDYYDNQHFESKRAEHTSSYKYHSYSQRLLKEDDSKKPQQHVKKPCRTKGKKKCSNCHATDSPSWRRSISKSSKGELVCNACGLYEKTAKRKRMLVTGEDGATKVVRKRDPRGFCCSKCGAEDSTRWRRFDERTVHCEKCVRSRR